ncbi:hypothetical protein [Clostridium sp. 'White wine YQ']|uniref:hypothetical protein n=1 Tax=Clostridium sp. 'White wine YQ' TaxID=3027474 RepID=UPI002365F5C7|nr:hypothetical protein [Clostridium sp. 'White wine YQ']MDD7794652.1 hypothetical protein [Clostridium sp. 'White wine YQ']
MEMLEILFFVITIIFIAAIINGLSRIKRIAEQNKVIEQKQRKLENKLYELNEKIDRIIHSQGDIIEKIKREI